jgi:hypothetical protein
LSKFYPRTKLVRSEPKRSSRYSFFGHKLLLGRLLLVKKIGAADCHAPSKIIVKLPPQPRNSAGGKRYSIVPFSASNGPRAYYAVLTRWYLLNASRANKQA